MNTIPLPSKSEDELHAMLSPELRIKLAMHERSVTAPKGTNLILRGIRPDHLVILMSGRVEIKFAGLRESVSLDGELDGKVFGMRSVVSEDLPEIDVTCVDVCHVTFLPANIFQTLLKTNSEIYFTVAKILSSDLQIANRMLRMCRCSQGNRNQAIKASLL
jgi:CRP-like cAMP-binding protein